MKKQSLFYNIICVLALTACSSSTRYVISGTVPEDLNGKYIYIYVAEWEFPLWRT
ncbi:hypothetical protein [Odoribacter splanchnicus]|uniref:hypothetical protein n=1 Tax=Odoribacter splanchnicus TaxID=28118 RepID=UPI0013A670E2|nr:hypothetical protein [Odoribacter splanchnicus]